MNVNLSSRTVSFLKESFISSITAQQKKIMLIALVVIGIVAATIYVATQYVFKANPVNGPEKKSNVSKPLEEGEFKNGILVKGKKTWDNKQGIVKEEGEFENGQLHGIGKRTFSDGQVDEGKFIKGNLAQGKHSRLTNTGYLIEEEGEFTLKNGDVVCLHGKGKSSLTSKDYSLLEEGEFQFGHFHGKGKRTENGTVSEGNFVNRDLNGKGISTYPDGTIEDGIFQNNCFIQGKKTKANGQIEEGKFTFKFNAISKNPAESNLLHGTGKRTYPDGQIEEGEFTYGTFTQGKKTHIDKSVSEGPFVDGLLHGQGKRTYPHVVIMEGKFEKGILVPNIPSPNVSGAPASPKQNPDPIQTQPKPTLVSPTIDPKKQQHSDLKKEILESLKSSDLDTKKLKNQIEEFSKLSISIHAEYLTTYEEILKALAKGLHDALPSETWLHHDSVSMWFLNYIKLMPGVVQIVWKMQDFNPLKDSKNEDVFYRVIKLRKEFLSIEIQMKRLLAELNFSEQNFASHWNDMKKIFSDIEINDHIKEERKVRDQKRKEIADKIEPIKAQLFQLSK